MRILEEIYLGCDCVFRWCYVCCIDVNVVWICLFVCVEIFEVIVCDCSVKLLCVMLMVCEILYEMYDWYFNYCLCVFFDVVMKVLWVIMGSVKSWACFSTSTAIDMKDNILKVWCMVMECICGVWMILCIMDIGRIIFRMGVGWSFTVWAWLRWASGRMINISANIWDVVGRMSKIE